MPPKKAATNSDAGEAGGPFKWEGPNDTKLLLLTQGRYVKPDEYPQLSSAFPGTSIGSIRNRISALRVKQRDLYLDLAWDLPEGGAGHSAKKTATPRKTPGSKTVGGNGKKRGADVREGDGGEGEGEDGGEEVATPSKKPRAKKAKTQAKKKEEESVEDAVEEEDVSSGGDAKSVDVKEEVLDEELDEMV